MYDRRSVRESCLTLSYFPKRTFTTNSTCSLTLLLARSLRLAAMLPLKRTRSQGLKVLLDPKSLLFLEAVFETAGAAINSSNLRVLAVIDDDEKVPQSQQLMVTDAQK
jgi:hypothetical protein